MSRFIRALAVVVVAAPLAGCGGQSPATPTAPAVGNQKPVKAPPPAPPPRPPKANSAP